MASMSPRFLLTCVIALAVTAAASAKEWDDAVSRFRAAMAEYATAQQAHTQAVKVRDDAQQALDRAMVRDQDGRPLGKLTISAAERDRLKAVIDEAQKEADQHWAAMNRAARRALDAVGSFDSKQAVKYVTAVGVQAENPQIQQEAYECLEGMSSPAAVDEMIQQLESTRVTLLARALARALWRQSDVPKARETVRHLLDGRDDNKIIAALDAMPYAMTDGDMSRALDLLSHKTWQVRVAAVELLTRSLGTENEERIVPALILRVGEEDGRVLDSLVRTLSKYMKGANGGHDVELWGQLWEIFKQDRAKADENEPGRTVASTYYGIPIYSKRIVFVLDMSDSMNHPHGIHRKSKPKRPAPVITGDDDEEKGDKKKKRRELDWDKIKTKIDLAKAELIRTIEELADDVTFTVVVYNSEYHVLEKQLLPATEKNKKMFIAKVKGITASSSTCAFFTALFEAMSINIQGARPKLKDSGQADLRVVYADTIFFLTDGFPTVNGGGKGNLMPPETIEKNMQELAKQYETKKVCINTIGIGQHATDLLRRIAEGTGGTYVDFSR